jgi:small subunit ribosomal protein S3
MIVGKGGSEVEKLQETVSKMIGKPVAISIVEVHNPDLNAQLVAENIAQQLEKRVSFRRAMKLAMGRAMKLGAKGIKTCVSGRLGGAEIARTEHYHEGTIPLQTLRADIDYGFAEAKTTYGRIGVKVWLYKGEVLTGGPRTTSVEAPRRDRRDRRDGDRRDRAPRREGGERRGDKKFGERKQFSAGPRGPQGRPFQRPAAPKKEEGGAE